jgi:predicted Zn-dependent protease
MQAEAGDANSALQSLEMSIKLEQGYAPAHRRRGELLLDLERLGEAEMSFRSMMDLEPKSIAARVGLARVHIKRDEHKKAIAILDELVSEGASEPYIYQLLGNAARRSGNLERAREAFARAASPKEPQWPDPWREERNQYQVGLAAKLREALALTSGPQITEGIQSLEHLRAEHPENVAVLSNLGAAYCKNGQIQEGIDALQAALKVRPEHFFSLVNLSQALEAAGRSAESLEYAEKSAQVYPEMVQAHMRRGFALAKLDRKKEALEAFETARRLDSRSTQSLFWCGVMRSDLRAWPEAVKDFEAVLAQDSRMAGALPWLARAKAEAGDFRGAREALSLAEQQNPPPPNLAQVRQRIDQLDPMSMFRR